MTDIEKIKAALAAGPTPGPWTTASRGAYWHEEEADVTDAAGNDIPSAEFVKPVGDVPTTRGQMYMRDAVYIAACSPDVIAALIARLEAAEALAAPSQPEGADPDTTEIESRRYTEGVADGAAGAAAPDERDGARYRAFFSAGLPITFMGVEYEDKASLDAAIDAFLSTPKGGV